MLKLALKEQEERMLGLIPRIRRGECTATETWLLQDFLSRDVDRLSDYKVTGTICDIPEDSDTPQDAWLRGLVILYDVDVSEEDVVRDLHILEPHVQNPLCASLLGTAYSNAGEWELAFEYFRRSAEAGCEEGICRLAECYAIGIAVDRDERHAYELHCKAAKTMYPEALASLGDCLRNGDVVRGLQYYTQASNLGSTAAKGSMAWLYWTGLYGATPDLRRAATLYRQLLLVGDSDGAEDFKVMQRRHPEAIVPCGEWRPDPFMHQFVPDQMHHEMETVLLMHARQGSIFSQLPRVLLPHICFWICTDPI